jgi:hypothetical protein
MSADNTVMDIKNKAIKDATPCNFLYDVFMETTDVYTPRFLSLKKKINIAISSSSVLKQIFSYTQKEKMIMPPDYIPVKIEYDVLNLKPGEWVEVRSFDEILKTLDEKSKHRGIVFMPEMKKFCGKRFQVFKKVEKIMSETTGEMRKIKSPTVFLEGTLCDGEFHQGCDRACYCYWREIWLKRV